ncbi:tRNA dihydrouridine synthase [Teredinibacter haidensis]|uniref:tRNA dihydrouridine synthase n=1 Tax=Teredinibacter haidensis TaxID=2731755 RepID=UPI0009491E1F|nr:tRNA-dihydrouridine synthase [Teredinibacter haidensis]
MRIFLAPMEGVVDHPMRRTLNAISSLPKGNAIDVCVTEFIRISDQPLPSRVFLRSCPELLGKDNYSVRVQLLGSNPEALALNARKAAQLGAPAIDLNFGCPAKTVNKNKGGACLLDETTLIYEIVSKVREAVPATTPVSVKIRLGYQERDSYLRNAEAIEKAGANELVVHARSKSDGYSPPAYWPCISEIKQHIKIPVIANGEVWSLDDYLLCRKQSGCADVMLGRGLLAKPDLALAIKAHINGYQHIPLNWRGIAQYLYQFFLETSELYPAKYTGNRLKQWLHYLQRNYPEAQKLFKEIKHSRERIYIQNRLQRDITNKAQ